MNHIKIGFIGGGNMTTGIVAGLVQRLSPEHIFVSDINQERLQFLSSTYKINTHLDYATFIQKVDIVILAIKPQGFSELLPKLNPHLTAKQVVVSIAAGISVDALQNLLPTENLPIVRAMPSMPAKVGNGVTGLYGNSFVTDAQKSAISAIFESCGIASWLQNESQIAVVAAVAGSSPAYFFYFLEIMGKVGESLGLDHHLSEQMAIETMLGSAKLAKIGDLSLEALRKSICSPNGTTEQAIASFKKDELDKVVDRAMRATVKRGDEISEEINAHILRQIQ